MKAGKAEPEEPILVAMERDEWEKLIELLDATLDALDTKGSDYAVFKGMIGHIENQTTVHSPVFRFDDELRRTEAVEKGRDY
jgi:hypothetical protein